MLAQRVLVENDPSLTSWSIEVFSTLRCWYVVRHAELSCMSWLCVVEVRWHRHMRILSLFHAKNTVVIFVIILLFHVNVFRHLVLGNDRHSLGSADQL